MGGEQPLKGASSDLLKKKRVDLKSMKVKVK